MKVLVVKINYSFLISKITQKIRLIQFRTDKKKSGRDKKPGHSEYLDDDYSVRPG